MRTDAAITKNVASLAPVSLAALSLAARRAAGGGFRVGHHQSLVPVLQRDLGSVQPQSGVPQIADAPALVVLLVRRRQNKLLSVVVHAHGVGFDRVRQVAHAPDKGVGAVLPHEDRVRRGAGHGDGLRAGVESARGVRVLAHLVLPRRHGTERARPTHLAQIAAKTSSLSTLLTAVGVADLAAALSDDNSPVTVFAPSNDAFAKIPQADLDALLADKEALTKVLLYHVVSGTVPAADVVSMSKATTLQGSSVSISVEGSDVMLNSDVKVTATDIMASNGVVHLIDTVLMPPKNIAELAAATPSLSTLLTAVGVADLAAALSDDSRPVTVFAPSNDAFAKIPQADLDALLADKEALTKVLLYHLVDGTVPAADVVSMSKATTLQGSDVSISVEGSNVMLNGDVKVTATDIMASNGVVHLIDTVLMPPSSDTAVTEDVDNSKVEEIIADLSAALDDLRGAAPRSGVSVAGMLLVIAMSVFCLL